MDVKNRIIREAAPLFFQRGIRSMTMSDIATELGISKRTLYEVFSNKEELLEACFDESLRRTDEAIEVLMQSSSNVIEALMKIYAQHLQTSQSMNKTIVHDLKKYYQPIYNQIQSRKENSFLAFIPLMTEGIKQGLIREDTNLEVVIWLVKAQFKALIDDEYIPTNKYSANEFIRIIILNFIRGIVTPLGSAQIEQMMEKIKQE